MASRYMQRKYGNGMTVTIEEDYSGLAAVLDAAKKAQARHIRFGWLNGKRYPSSHKNRGMYIAQIAEWQEYGTHNIPSRPYAMLNFLQMTTKAIPDIEKYFKSVCSGYFDDSHLDKIAEDGKKNFASIVMGQQFARLSKVTIRIKGHSFQMDDTGYLLHNYEGKVFKRDLKKIDV